MESANQGSGGKAEGLQQLKQEEILAEMKGKIKILRYLEGVFPEYQPEVGKVYDGEYFTSRKRVADFAVIDIKDKKIVVRVGEYEIVEE